ncbi:hypothetical protein [Gemelliphila palaticanis]|uniref:Uncharacterized protein n=1 Tax=Gemelliphila palaticanis TaxID=81950 RepID=A0ABX2SX78_9BACL|nr:hypothetical protein [Gemella palaticanis]MBF0714887.1 hypothetical protein [Gemella palaticanis]NYS46817.1 hypothetical protein [Gemella palaticanis]
MNNDSSKQVKNKYLMFYRSLREELMKIKIVDPACGSYVIIMTVVKSLIK